MPRKQLKPTEEQRRQVKLLAAVGTPSHDIARYWGVSEKTLSKYYRQELFRGPLEANAKVGQSLYEMATDRKHQWQPSTGAKPAVVGPKKQGGMSRPATVPDFVVALEKKAA